MAEKPDWTQRDATPDEIKAWMRDHAAPSKTDPTHAFAMTAGELAWMAFNHFARPYHLSVMREWAKEVYAEGDT